MAGSTTLGDRIRELRNAKKLEDPRFSQRGFSEMLNLSPTYLSRVEGDELIPAADTIKRMAVALGTNPDELLALAEKVDPELNGIILERPKAMAAFLRTASGMSETQLDRFRMYMEAEKKQQEESSNGKG